MMPSKRRHQHGEQHREFRGCRSALASNKLGRAKDPHGYPKRIQLVMVIAEMPVALITVMPGNRGE